MTMAEHDEETSDLHKPIHEYVFGFGSIINVSTHGPWLSSSSENSDGSLPGQLATIQSTFGYQRSWNFRSATGFTALGVSKPMPGEGQQPANINGVLFRIAAHQLPGFDRREVGYDRIEVPKDQIELLNNNGSFKLGGQLDIKADEKIWIYVPQKVSLAFADVDHPILQSYVDTVLQGCLEWGGEDMCEHFVQSTSGWSPYFLNDTPSSRRPWLFRKEYNTIDRILSKYPSTHFAERRHPEEFASAFLIKMLRGSWCIPRRNTVFTGRDAEISEIHARLTTRTTDQVSTAKLVIAGMGGAGKSQICTEYCYRYYPSYYGLVIWLNAQSAESIVAGYRQLMADTSGVDVKDKAANEVIAEIKARLYRSKVRWLLVFDNLEDQALLDKFVPSNTGAYGHVLVTSRILQTENDAYGSQALILGCFQPSESLELLCRAAGKENLHSEDQKQAAYKLADHLGHLPLALGMAAAYMYRCDVDCEEYVSRYVQSESNGILLGHEGVSSSLSLSLNAIKNENHSAWEVARMLAWMGPDQITKKLLRDLLVAKAEQTRLDDEAIAMARSEAAALALNSVSSKPLLVIGGLAVAVLVSSGRQVLHSKRGGIRFGLSLVAVVSTAVALSVQVKLKSMATTSAFHNSAVQAEAGNVVCRQNSFSGDVFEKTDEIWNILKSFSLLVVKEGKGSIHRLLAQALRESQDDEASRRNLQICLRALRKAWKFRPELVDTWQDTANILEHVKAVVSHSVKIKGGPRLDTAHLSREAGVYAAMALNRFKEAQYSLELSLSSLDEMDTASSASVSDARAAALHELGRVLRYEGQFDQAEEALRKALHIRNEVATSIKDSGARHNVAATLHELGVLEVKKHNLDSAANYLQEALDLRRVLEQDSKRERGDAEAACASTLHQLAAVHLARKPPALEISESLLNEALSLDMQIGQRAATLKQLARVSIRFGQFDAAERRLVQALELYVELYGENTLHINVAAVRFQQGALAFQREQLDLAWHHFSECLRARKFVYAYLQGHHIEVSTVLHQLGCVAMAQKHYDKACEMLEAEKEILESLCEASSHHLERLHQARLTNLTWLKKCAKEQGDDDLVRRLGDERSELKRTAKPSDIHTVSHEQTRVNLLQQEALRCRLMARQFALAESPSKVSAKSRLKNALESLQKEVARSTEKETKLYNVVVHFHRIVVESLTGSNERTKIFEACDLLRDALREHGIQVNDTVCRKKK